MGVFKREGSPNWWYSYRDADGKVQRRTARTTDKHVAEVMMAQAFAEVAAIKQARLSNTASIFGLYELQHGSDRERIDRLDRFMARLCRLLVGQYELMRLWVEDEVKAKEAEYKK
jgi:hypothetical protein